MKREPAAPERAAVSDSPAQSGPITSPASRHLSTPALQEERRLVTAVFCDLVGFTPISEQLDPEEVRDLQAAFFSAMAGQIERYGGVVEKYAGDAVLALFGAPIAHEDDAERAVLCALGMQQSLEPVAERTRAQWNVEPGIRVGVNTGDVVAGTWNASGRQDVAVTGDAVNTAARIQSAADAGEILVGAETMRLTRRRIEYGERREVTLKGKAGLVPVWRAIGIREEFGERWEGYETPLVGRDREMVHLLDAWVRAQSGEGQMVAVVGDAGVGKSRLIAEFLGRVSASGAVRVLRARSLSYGQEISLWLIADVIRSIFGIKEQERPADVAAKLRSAIPVMIPEPASAAEAVDVIGEVLGLPIGESPVARAGPQIRRQALIRGLRSILAAVAERAPTVAVLEDLHWMDNASREVLVEVLADVLGLRMLVVAAQRPGWTPPWSEWGWPERITLRPLDEQDAAVLAGAVLGGMQLRPELEQYVAERAGGNPFFVEEMLRALGETGGLVERDGAVHLAPGAAERLPSTLTEVLLARLDRLEADTRQVAQVASVIGRTFSVPLLAEVAGQSQDGLQSSLTQLQRAEIAFPRRNPDLEYVFKHVSMRDVAYNTLVQKRRQELHLRAARAIAALYPSDEYVEMIAYHYGRTDAAEAAEWLERAGDRAAAVYAAEEARGHFEEALRRYQEHGGDPAVRARLQEKLGVVLYTAGLYDEALERLAEAASIARERKDLESAARIVAQMGMVHRFGGTPAEGLALVSPVIDLMAWAGPSEALASLYIALTTLSFLVGRYEETYAGSLRAAEIARAIDNPRLLGEAEERRGIALTVLGRPDEGRLAFEAALPLIEAGGDLLAMSRALVNVGEAAKNEGDILAARQYTERALAVDERVGNPHRLAFDLANLGDILLVLGDWPAARAAADRAMAVAGERQSVLVANTYLLAGKVALWTGDWVEADRYLRLTLSSAMDTGDRQLSETAQALIAQLDIAEGRPGDAISRLQPLVESAERGLSILLPMLAMAVLEAGDAEKAIEMATTAADALRQHEPITLVDALRVLGLALSRQQRAEEARAVLDEALALSRSLPFPYAEAHVLVAMGQLGEALTIYERLGAMKDIERTRQQLAISG